MKALALLFNLGGNICDGTDNMENVTRTVIENRVHESMKFDILACQSLPLNIPNATVSIYMMHEVNNFNQSSYTNYKE